MVDFIVSVDDPAQLAGISWMRERHNSTLPMDENVALIGEARSDAEYVSHLAMGIIKSFAEQKAEFDAREALRAAREDGDMTKLDALRAELAASKAAEASAVEARRR